MLIAPELKNAMSLINRLEKLETKNFKLFVRLLFSENGFIISPVGKKQCIKLYVEQHHHLLAVYINHREKYDTETIIADDADLDELANKIMQYLKYMEHVVEHEQCS
jgi:hypothetical protein